MYSENYTQWKKPVIFVYFMLLENKWFANEMKINLFSKIGSVYTKQLLFATW